MIPSSTDLDLGAFALQAPPAESPSPDAPRMPPRHRPGEHFLRGPIPWSWIAAAGRLPGRALHVALVIWRESAMKRNGTIAVSLSGTERTFGFDRSTASRGLRALEMAGLVSVIRKAGSNPTVTLLAAPRGSDGDGSIDSK
jgi:DNA-binding transcriptional ArsR family regulator